MRLLFLQQWISGEVLKAVGWTLIHSLWQGLFAALLAAIIIIATKRSSARIRYNLLGLVLFLFVIATTVTFCFQLNTPISQTEAVNAGAIPGTDVAQVTTNIEVVTPDPVTLKKFITYFNANAGIFVLIWAIFFFLHCIKLIAGLAGIHLLKNSKAYAVPEEWGVAFSELKEKLGISQAVKLLQSEFVKVPVAIGFFKPIVLLPLGLLSNLPPEQIETILLHELAHISRRDYLVNILQRIAEAVFFFNPAVLWISSLVRQEREACCDDIVVATITHKVSYLQALISFQEYSLGAPGYAMAINSKKQYLLYRVKRMITRENKKLDIMERIVLAIGLVALTAFTLVPKNDAINKKYIAPVILPEDPRPPSLIQSQSVDPSIIQKKYETVKKDDKKVITPLLALQPVDTVPSKKEQSDTREPKFRGISSTINDDGKTKTETTTVTDENGKKYTYTRLNNKITSLIIDGKNIPENEMGNYSGILEKMEMAIQENRTHRLIEMEHRKLAMTQRTEELRNRLIEKKLLHEFQGAQKQQLLEENRQLRLLQKSGNKLQNRQLEVKKLLLQLREKRMTVPMLNGREISNIDMHMEKPVVAIVNGKVNVTNETAKIAQNTINLKQAIAISKNVAVNVNVDKIRPMSTKPELNIYIDNKLTEDFDSKPRAGQNGSYPLKKLLSTLPGRPLKSTQNIGPIKTMPSKLFNHQPVYKGRVIS